MHAKILEAVIEQCRKRIAEGDCPVTLAVSLETLEEAVGQLATALDVARYDRPVPPREGDAEVVKDAARFRWLLERETHLDRPGYGVRLRWDDLTISGSLDTVVRALIDAQIDRDSTKVQP